MKVVYVLRNPGLATRTPEGWCSAVIAPDDDGRYSADALAEVGDADILAVGIEPITRPVFEAAPDLKLVQRLGVGVDSVDLEAAARHGVWVCNMPHFNAGTVAEHAVMMMLALFRRVFQSSLLMKGGQWPLHTVVAEGMFDLRGKTVGILGLGEIGTAVAERLVPFQVELLYHDTRRRTGAEERLGIRAVGLDELLAESDVLTCHLPLTPDTRVLLGREELRRMKPSALLINTARGAVVDEEALSEALREGTLAGAGIDVFTREPPAPDHPLRRCPNVLLTPHIAGQTREAMDRMVESMLENLHRIARGEEPRHVVSPGRARPATDGR